MNSIDGLDPDMRGLVYEYGLAIVAAMINDGYDDADALRETLEGRRRRLQAAWLETQHITPELAKRLKAGFFAPRGPGRRNRRLTRRGY